MYSIKALCDEFGLSRSTLLYYEKMTLIKAPVRNSANYRMYSDKDKQRLAQVCLYRQVGVPVKDILQILDGETHSDRTLLEKQLERINQDILALQAQQTELLKLLKRQEWTSQAKLTKESWSQMLRESGLSEDDMWAWHDRFEARFPDEHERFLKDLGMSQREREHVRRRSQHTDPN
ncbi:MerR family transcriptional regulator [Marinomonas mediterranea]|uniref:MerR family transcriptional regulator n=1 Tax=Marinomonas mediterranea TaxID=119864 RepID=UPI00234AC8F6|nr:MerR family transcriptional regulator [Marinomonas mediterranea]WCN11014.1 MerR family transcriptional regulator [Marinomonas mediterranea]